MGPPTQKMGSTDQVSPGTAGNQMKPVDMDQMYFDDQVFSDIGGSRKNQNPQVMPNSLQQRFQPVQNSSPVNKSAHASMVAPVQPVTAPKQTFQVAPTTVTKEKVGHGLYALHFSIYYKTVVGESIAVVGNLSELGKWKEYRCHLEWTDGHIW